MARLYDIAQTVADRRPWWRAQCPLNYRLTVPVFQRGLTTLSAYLDKAEAFASETGIDPVELVATAGARPLPLNSQYQPRATDSVSCHYTANGRRCTEIRR